MFVGFVGELPVAFPDASEPALRAYFYAFDVDGNGAIDMREVPVSASAHSRNICRDLARLPRIY